MVVILLYCLVIMLSRMLKHAISIHLTSVNRSSLTLTYSQLCKNIRKVFLKPLPTFCWLGHVLAVLQTIMRMQL